MKFTQAAPDNGYFMRWTSDTGRWEFGFQQMLFGVRVSANPVSGPWGEYAVMDYCAGPSESAVRTLFMLTCTILEGQPESLTGDELRAMLPGYEVRPVVNDPACMAALTALAVETLKRAHVAGAA